MASTIPADVIHIWAASARSHSKPRWRNEIGDRHKTVTSPDQLIANWEDEVVEFKEAGNDYDTDKIGRYFSAIANQANLQDAERGWLVFGVSNKTRGVVGTSYREDAQRLHSLKIQMRDGTEPGITFREIYELAHADGRVVLFGIPAAPRGMPINWKGHYYARAGESLVPIPLDKLDSIRNQTLATD